MARRPRIVIPARFSASASALRYRADVAATKLVHAVYEAGGEPLVLHPVVPPGIDMAALDDVVRDRIGFADGVLLPGGGDLAARWAGHDAGLLTPRGLSTAGWRHRLGSPEDSTAVVDGKRVPVRDIEGVLTRLWCVGIADLAHIVPADREYVSMEMTAFLLSWLTTLECPVPNRPSPSCLAGPNWRAEEWTQKAARLGIPVRPAARRTALGQGPLPPEEFTKTTVTVVGDWALGAADNALKAHARRLAEHAGTGLLDVYFDGPGAGAAFAGVNLWPDITRPEVADAMLASLKGGRPC